MRAAIYARFSTDLQNARSAADQVVLCRDYAAREGLSVIRVFEDAAVSGASVHGRGGMLDLLAAARAKAFDVLIVESFDRLSRRQADSHAIYDVLSFNGIEIRAVHDGRADPVTFGLRAMVAQMQREDVAHKVRRGLTGVVRTGRHAGGRSYGYRTTPGQPGVLQIDETEAKIVREIFAAYLAGEMPRAIAARLNVRGIKPPRGARWNGSTIHGSAARGNGILQNELYVGRIVWNRQRFIKDPDTGKRVSRPNPKEALQVAEAPHLRIIDDETFARVKARKAVRAKIHISHRRAPARALSGLLRCGCCGGGMTSMGRDRTGKMRVQCTAYRESRSCENNRMTYLETIEARVFGCLTDALAHPDLIARYLKTYNEEMRRLNRTADSRRARLETRLGEIERGLQRGVDAIIDGTANKATIGDTLRKLEGERDAVRAEIAGLETPAQVISIHPAAAAQYRADLANFAEIAAEGAKPINAELIAAVRNLVQSVTLHPLAGRGQFDIEVTGRLAALIRAQTAGSRHGDKVVAGAGFEPATFRL